MKDRTKLLIADKMKELMKNREISRIRITEICRAADIERSTFYYHFKDKYDLIAWIFCYDIMNTDVIDLQDAARSMEKMKNELLFYRRAYEDTSQNALWQYMYEYFTNEYTEAARKKLGTDSFDAQLIFSIRLYCYGAVGMAKDWILNDNVTPAITIVEMMFRSMPESMRSIYFVNES